MSDEQKRLDTVHNERLKLTATWLNNVGVGCVIAGFVAPTITYGATGAVKPLALTLTTLPWFITGVALHFMGRRTLKGMRS